MDWEELFYGFDFDYHLLRDQQIDTKTSLYFVALVDQRERYLAFVRDIPELELAAHALLVNGLKQAGAQDAMNFDRRGKDLVREITFEQPGLELQRIFHWNWHHSVYSVSP